MKVLFLLFGVTFLVFQVHAEPEAGPGDESLTGLTMEDEAPQGEENGPAGEGAAAPQARSFCYGGRGYCMIRSLRCPSGLMYKEQYNDCYQRHAFKCCV